MPFGEFDVSASRGLAEQSPSMASISSIADTCLSLSRKLVINHPDSTVVNRALSAMYFPFHCSQVMYDQKNLQLAHYHQPELSEEDRK